MHRVYRNGRLYDQLDPNTHAVLQIVRSLAEQYPGDQWEVKNEKGEVYYQAKTST